MSTKIIVKTEMTFADFCDYYIAQLDFFCECLPAYALSHRFSLKRTQIEFRHARDMALKIDRINGNEPFAYKRFYF